MTLPFSKILIRSDNFKEKETRKNLITTALEAGFMDIIINSQDKEFESLGRYNSILLEDDTLTNDGEKVGEILTISSKSDLEKAYALMGKISFLLIIQDDEKIIPLENLISRFQNSDTKLYLQVKTLEEAKLAFEIMEIGFYGVVVSDNTLLKDFAAINQKTYPNVFFETAKVTRVERLTLGDRVCIDTCSILEEGEGMLIGSKSSALFLVCSESFKNHYVNERPFRVNAGSVHSYILMPNGSTKYLSELGTGDEVLTRKPNGTLRTVTIGRIKIETRPLLLIEVCFGKAHHSVILQNAETIRLGTPKGYVPVTELSKGDLIYLRHENFGRHFGHLIDETIVEK